MAGRTRLDALRQAVLGSGRGSREAEVSPDGRVIINQENDVNSGNQPEQEVVSQPRPSRMSEHTWGVY